MKKIVVIFGGADPESAEARRFLGEQFSDTVATATATFGGKAVHNGNAYQADGFSVDTGSMEGVTKAVIFECNPACVGTLEVVAKCDHHNPGDKGFGLGPERYLEASSLGQLLLFLGWEASMRQLLVAASDHCPAAAYQGKCPGITLEAFKAHRLAEKVAFYAMQPKFAHKADVEVLEKVIASAVTTLQTVLLVDGVRDLRGLGMVDELPEAALRTGEAYMASLPDTDREQKPTGNTKIVLGGHTSPEVVEKFMAWAATLPNIIGKPYGNPTRGFAGVVVKPE